MKKYKVIRSTQGFLLGTVFECDNPNDKNLSSLLDIPAVSNKIYKIKEGLYRYQTVHYTLIIKEVN